MTPSKSDLPWSELKAKLQQKYAQLTDDDFSFIEGKGEELVVRLQRKLGMSREETERAIADLETNANQMADQARKVAGDVREKARGTYEEARHRASDVYAQGREQIRSFESDVEEYVREKPLTSVMIALGAGFVIGWAIRH